MKSIRIEPIAEGCMLLVDVVCDCGNNGLTDKTSGEVSFKHEIRIGAEQDKILACRCGKRYHIHSQGTHIHVLNYYSALPKKPNSSLT
jgi:hypothetical protein